MSGDWRRSIPIASQTCSKLYFYSIYCMRKCKTFRLATLHLDSDLVKLPVQCRSLNSDYRGSGFDRGHLAAAGNHRICQKHVDQTFFLSNIAPQVGVGFNRNSWNRLEKYVRKLTKTYKNVYVCTGPLYVPR